MNSPSKDGMAHVLTIVSPASVYARDGGRKH